MSGPSRGASATHVRHTIITTDQGAAPHAVVERVRLRRHSVRITIIDPLNPEARITLFSRHPAVVAWEGDRLALSAIAPAAHGPVRRHPRRVAHHRGHTHPAAD